MPTLTLYPTSVKTGFSFTTAQLANVVGNNTSTATHTDTIVTGTTIGGVFYFNMTDIPASAIITSIQCSLIANANATARRKAYAVDIYKPENGAGYVCYIDTALTTSLAQYDGTITAANLSTAQLTTAALRDNFIEWTGTFSSTNTTSTTTTWQKFFLTITYELTTGSNILFLGENF